MPVHQPIGHYISVCLLVGLVATCKQSIPIEEMGQAKLAIMQAEQVRADEYAFKEISDARFILMQVHEFVATGDFEMALSEAKKARRFALKAFEKSNSSYFISQKAEVNEALENECKIELVLSYDEQREKIKQNMQKADELFAKKEYGQALEIMKTCMVAAKNVQSQCQESNNKVEEGQGENKVEADKEAVLEKPEK